jgi:hypothetical protein
MTQAGLDEALRQFLMVHVHSFEDLEVLLLARKRPGQKIDAKEAARTLNIELELTVGALTKLVAAGLLTESLGNPSRYEYSAEGLFAERVDELVRAYDEQRIAVITTIASNAIVRVKSSAIKTFAEAFLLRKDRKKDG